MPKLVCPCGFVHDLSPIPDEGWVTVRDVDYEALVASERAGPGSGESAPSMFVRLAGLLYECTECGRLMWKKPGKSEFRIFRPDM
jgi:hypothetical protein